jgi:ABC-2 type transport system permease protein
VSAYLSTFKARGRVLLQYREAALAGVVTQLFWGGIRIMIYEAFYRSTNAPQPMAYAQTVTYLWLIQAMLLLLPWHADPEASASIRDGTVAYELVRPADLYWYWFSRGLAQRVLPVFMRAAPIFFIAGPFLGLQAPPSLAAALAWLATIGGAALLSCAITMLATISLLWSISGEGVSRLLATLASLLSGSVVPLAFFPDWAQPILNALPFRGLMDIPFRLYVGSEPPGRWLPLLAHQLAWTAALVLVGRLLLARGKRRLVVQGG